MIKLLAPPSSNGFSEPFANRAHDQVGTFLDVVVAAAAAFAVYLANHVSPALAKARLITLAALVEMGVALLFGVVTALAQFGADGIGGEGKFLTLVMAIGEGAVVVVAALFVWMTWQILNPQTARPAAQQPGQYGGGWTAGPGAGSGGGQSGQQYSQAAPPPGGFGWTPQQGSGQPGQQPGQPGQSGQQAGQSGQAGFGQQAGQLIRADGVRTAGARAGSGFRRGRRAAAVRLGPHAVASAGPGRPAARSGPGLRPEPADAAVRPSTRRRGYRIAPTAAAHAADAADHAGLRRRAESLVSRRDWQ